jgi:Tfp pilus assembly protein PilN
MPLINLIETQILAAAKEQQKTRVSKMTLVGTSAIMGLGYLVLAGQGLGLASQQSQTETKIKTLKPLISQIENLKKEESIMAPKLRTLEDARELTNKWSRLMVHLTRNTPTNVWLTQVRSVAVDIEKPIQVTFNGIGKSNTEAGEMMLRMQNSADLEAVNLVGTAEKQLEKTTAFDFEIRGDIVGTAEKQKDTAKEEKKEGI